MSRASDILLGVGVVAPAIAWFATQQGHGALVYFDCGMGGFPIGPLTALTGLIACLASAWLGWRQRSVANSSTRHFVDQLVPGLAAIFALANLGTLVAACLIPPCAR